MDIVDGQLHINMMGIDPCLAVMDSVGISAALLDAYSGYHDDKARPWPGVELPNGAWRPTCELPKTASQAHPTRFAYLLRIEMRDPELDDVIQSVKSDPHGLAVRILVGAVHNLIDYDEIDIFRRGGYDDLFAAAERRGVPLSITIPEHVHLLARYLEKFPNLTCIVDHCGVVRKEQLPEGFKPVLDIARYPNVALKWGHAPDLLSREAYPFSDIMPYLHQALKAYGPERVMWASDHTQNWAHHSWAQDFSYIRDSNELSTSDKEWILGRSLRTILKWPKPSATA